MSQTMTVQVPEGKVLVDREDWERIKRDLNDCFNAAQTIFYRCACGRVTERGIICPTNQEGGTCEAGS